MSEPRTWPPFALSIQQPWAWAILHAGKDIENRTWYTSHRGAFLIHAAKAIDCDGFRDLRALGIDPPRVEHLKRGGLVGAAELVKVVQSSPSPWFSGPYGFRLAAARAFDLIPCRGALKFFRHKIADPQGPADSREEDLFS